LRALIISCGIDPDFVPMIGLRGPFSEMALVLADTSTDSIKGIDEMASIKICIFSLGSSVSHSEN
jgi:hypothetical protein